MNDDQQNSIIEKVANLMLHDDLSPDEQDVSKLQKYKNQVRKEHNLGDEEAMKIVYETMLYRKLKNSDSGDVLDKGNEFGAGFS